MPASIPVLKQAERRFEIAFIHVNGIKIYYEMVGTGPAILLLHGHPGNHTEMAAFATSLSRQLTVINIDMRGYGESDKPEGDCGISQIISDIHEILKHFQIEKAIVAGFSAGGRIAIKYFLAHPDRVDKLILIATDAKSSAADYGNVYRIIKLIVSKLFVVFGKYRFFVRALVRFLIYPYAFYGYNRDQEMYLVDEYLKKRKQLSGSVLRLLEEDYHNYDVRDELVNINVPVFILCGENDPISPVEDSKILNEGIRNSRLEIVPQAKHLLLIEKSGLCSEIILNWLSSFE